MTKNKEPYNHMDWMKKQVADMKIGQGIIYPRNSKECLKVDHFIITDIKEDVPDDKKTAYEFRTAVIKKVDFDRATWPKKYYAVADISMFCFLVLEDGTPLRKGDKITKPLPLQRKLEQKEERIARRKAKKEASTGSTQGSSQ